MPSEVSPFFAVEVLTANYIPHRWLFESFIEETLAIAGITGSNIYYLCRTKKQRFKLDSVEVSTDGDLSADIEIGNDRTVRFQVELATVFPFSNFDILDFGMLEPRYDRGVSSGVQIGLQLNAIDEPKTQVIPFENFVASNDIDMDNPPEIVYIGQSFDMLERWRNHKQINKTVSLLADDEELRIYFLHFKFFASFAQFGDVHWNSLLDMNNRNEQLYRDRIAVLEQALIQFYRPILNSQHVGGRPATASYTRIASQTGIKGVGMALGMVGPSYQFWSPHQCLTSEVVTLIDDSGIPSFSEGLDLEQFFDDTSNPSHQKEG